MNNMDVSNLIGAKGVYMNDKECKVMGAYMATNVHNRPVLKLIIAFLGNGITNAPPYGEIREVDPTDIRLHTNRFGGVMK